MRGKGITYDTGFINGGVSTREPFDPDVVRREMHVIRADLHCNAVRITGGDPDRLETAATHAAEAALEVWISPFTCDLTTGELLDLLADCAQRAERLRRRGAEVVLLTGSELSLFNVGFLPGDVLEDRLALLSAPHRLREVRAAVPALINQFLAEAVTRVREHFGGKISYASLPFEAVDWTPFDIVSTDAGYRSIEVADPFADGVRTLVAQGKPVAITEFGCATYRGASDRGARGGMIVEWDGPRPVRLDGEYARDEAEQARCLCELLDIFNATGVDAAFVNTFASYHLPHRSEPREDPDMASYGLVKVLEGEPGQTHPGMPWEPKAASIFPRLRITSNPDWRPAGPQRSATPGRQGRYLRGMSMTDERRRDTALAVWGGWEGHEPERTSGRFRAFLREEGFDVVVSNTLDIYLDRDLMGRVDLIVQTWTMGEIRDEQFGGLQEAVLRGAGFAGWHGGIIDSFRTHTGYQFMTGAQWVAHPDGIVDYSVEFVRDEKDHPLVAGLDDFRIHTEQYYLHMDQRNRVFATTTFGETRDAPWVEGTVMPVIWTRTWGAGRVFVNAIGHQDRDFDVPQVETVTRRGLLWAANAGRRRRA